MNIFEKASKSKLRFETSKGHLTTEDLWDLSLQSLDGLAKSVNKKLKEDSEESFISAKSTSNTELELKMEIIKRVIEVKLSEKEAALKRSEKSAQKRFLEDLLEKKKTEKLEGLSVEEIQEQLKSLESEV